MPLDAAEEAALSETIADQQARTPLELLGEKDLLGKIDIVLQSLNKREATIVKHRFGLNGLEAKTLEQVSELICVTRERVRQLEFAALAKLRRAFTKHLRPIEPEFPTGEPMGGRVLRGETNRGKHAERTPYWGGVG